MARTRKVVRAEVVKEWAKFPHFKQVLENELELVYQESSETFVSGDPYMTHEIKAKLIGRERLLLELIAFFDGELDLFFNERNGVELVGNDEASSEHIGD